MQIKLVRSGVHPDIVAAFERAEERCRAKEEVAVELMRTQIEVFETLCEQEKKAAGGRRLRLRRTQRETRLKQTLMRGGISSQTREEEAT